MASSIPLSVWVAAAVGVAGVSLAAITGDRQGSAARAESLVISPQTIAAMNTVQEDRAVARARKSLTLFRQKDEGYALARVIARNMIVEMPRSDGVATPVVTPGNPIKMSKVSEGPEHRVPWLGEHTDEVLQQELGLDAATIAALRVDGAIA